MLCTEDSTCGWHASCSAAGECEVHKLFADPLADIAMGAISFVIAGISLAAGVGGGGMFVPLLMLFLSFEARIATALSQAMLLGGAIAAFAYNATHSHPHVKSRPIIDYQLACLMGPCLMSGAQVGSLIHQVAPPAVLAFLLCVVLIDAARKGFANVKKIIAKEKEAASHGAPLKHAARAVDPDDEEEEEEPSTEEDDEEVTGRIRDAQLKLFFIWLFCLCVVLCKGLLVEICDWKWWLLIVTATVVLGAFGLWYGNKVSQEEPLDSECLDFRELGHTIVQWSFIAGLLAAICGIGGGMVMGPILTGLNVPPPVSSATTATTLLVLSSSIALVYICRNIAPLDYSIYLSLMTSTGAFAGKVVIGRWVKRTGKESVLVWALAGITISSTILMGGLGIYRVWVFGKEAFMPGELCVGREEDIGHQLFRKHHHHHDFKNFHHR